MPDDLPGAFREWMGHVERQLIQIHDIPEEEADAYMGRARGYKLRLVPMHVAHTKQLASRLSPWRREPPSWHRWPTLLPQVGLS